MKNIKNKIEVAAKLFDARNDRERILITACTAILILTLWQFLFYDPATQSQSKLNAELSTLQTKISTVDQQYNILAATKRVDPNREINKRISLAQQHLTKLDTQLQIKMKGLIQPTQMANILEQVLSQQTHLKFKRIQSLAAKPLLVQIPESNTNDDVPLNANESSPQITQAIDTTALTDIGVYQHGIEMEFSGSFLETLHYLQQLEKLPWNFYWDSVLFDVLNYPKSSVIIRVHTLSLEEGWLGV